MRVIAERPEPRPVRVGVELSSAEANQLASELFHDVGPALNGAGALAVALLWQIVNQVSREVRGVAHDAR